MSTPPILPLTAPPPPIRADTSAVLDVIVLSEIQDGSANLIQKRYRQYRARKRRKKALEANNRLAGRQMATEPKGMSVAEATALIQGLARGSKARNALQSEEQAVLVHSADVCIAMGKVARGEADGLSRPALTAGSRTSSGSSTPKDPVAEAQRSPAPKQTYSPAQPPPPPPASAGGSSGQVIGRDEQADYILELKRRQTRLRLDIEALERERLYQSVEEQKRAARTLRNMRRQLNDLGREVQLVRSVNMSLELNLEGVRPEIDSPTSQTAQGWRSATAQAVTDGQVHVSMPLMRTLLSARADRLAAQNPWAVSLRLAVAPPRPTAQLHPGTAEAQAAGAAGAEASTASPGGENAAMGAAVRVGLAVALAVAADGAVTASVAVDGGVLAAVTAERRGVALALAPDQTGYVAASVSAAAGAVGQAVEVGQEEEVVEEVVEEGRVMARLELMPPSLSEKDRRAARRKQRELSSAMNNALKDSRVTSSILRTSLSRLESYDRPFATIKFTLRQVRTEPEPSPWPYGPIALWPKPSP